MQTKGTRQGDKAQQARVGGQVPGRGACLHVCTSVRAGWCSAGPIDSGLCITEMHVSVGLDLWLPRLRRLGLQRSAALTVCPCVLTEVLHNAVRCPAPPSKCTTPSNPCWPLPFPVCMHQLCSPAPRCMPQSMPAHRRQPCPCLVPAFSSPARPLAGALHPRLYNVTQRTIVLCNPPLTWLALFPLFP